MIFRAAENRTPAELAAEYKARGWKPVPVRVGAKHPKDEEWQLRDFDPQRDFPADFNVGVQLGKVSNWLADVDLDCPEAVALASHFLPSTSAIFGRPGKQRSHYLYVIKDPENLPNKAARQLRA